MERLIEFYLPDLKAFVSEKSDRIRYNSKSHKDISDMNVLRNTESIILYS